MTTVNVNYQHASVSNYTLDLGTYGSAPYTPSNRPPSNQMPDILIRRPDTDYDLLHRRCLTTVNGFIYPNVADNYGVWILQGAFSMPNDFHQSVGLISFNLLNQDIETVPFSDPNEILITPDLVGGPLRLYDKMYIRFSKFEGTPMLVLGGYLQTPDPDIFYLTSEDENFVTYALHLSLLPYMQRLFETAHYRNIFTELNVDIVNQNPTLVQVDELLSDTTTQLFMNLGNSFLVKVPGTNLTVEQNYLESTTVPGNIITAHVPLSPLVVGHGKFADYRKKQSNGRWLIYISDGIYENYVFTRDINPTVINAHRQNQNTYKISPAFFLGMSLDRLESPPP